jgi:exopolysaccharide biosynthesis protein
MTDRQARSRLGRFARTRPRLTALLAVVMALLLVGGGGTAWALNRYVIDHVAISDVRSYESAHSTSTVDSSVPAPTVVVNKVTTGTGNNAVTYYVADVTLSDARQLRSAFAHNQFGENIIENTSAIAKDNGASFAINGDYYGFRDTGIVIRNGVIYRDKGARTGLAFYTDGTVRTYDETTTTAAQLLDAGVWNTLSFGPAIVEDGAVVDGIDQVEVDTNFGNHSIQGDQPRTAVGVIGPNHLVFVVVDGRSPGYSKGVTLPELGQIMVALGATTAYNIDGGGSSTMYEDGSVVNNPLGKGQERGTSDILYVAG